MTKRQRDFCDYVARGIGPLEAVGQAGYTRRGMEKILLANEEVQRLICQLREGEKVEGNAKAEKDSKAEDVAPNQEILFFLTNTMRGGDTEDIKIRMKAAELLGKSGKLFSGEEAKKATTPIVIVDDIP